MKIPFVLLAGFALIASAQASGFFHTYQSADVVLGQSDFTSNAPAATASGMSGPTGVAMDPATGKIFVADWHNNRVLRFSSAAAAQNGANAEAVFGQPDFLAVDANQGFVAPLATTLSFPFDVHVDSAGRLWVADFSNHRVLRFDHAATLGNDPPADGEFGQPGFTTRTAGTTQSTMDGPCSVAIGPGGELWVADVNNNRVLRFDSAAIRANGDPADGVLGQLDFTTGNSPVSVSASSFNEPRAIYPDADGRLWVADRYDNRVLRFDAAAAKLDGADADGVLGQSDFVSIGDDTTAATMHHPYGVYFDPAGNLWVSEQSNSRVTRFSGAASLANGADADLVLGSPDLATYTIGTTEQQLQSPFRVGPGPGGSLLVADFLNNRILRFSPIPPPELPPQLHLIGKKKITIVAAKITLKGTATDAAKVEVKVGSSAYKKASGTTNWTFKAKLLPGKTTILVRAVSPSGVTSPAIKITATRK